MNHANDISTSVFDFFADRSRSEFQFYYGRWNYILLRSRYDEETDFFYLLSRYNHDVVHDLSAKADYACIYSHVTGMVYGVSCYLDFLDKSRSITAISVRETLISNATAAILHKIDGKPVPETDDAEEPWRPREEYLQYNLSREAAEHFYKGTQPIYQPTIRAESLTIEQIIAGINHPEEAAEQLADEYITKNCKRINRRLWELSLLPARIAEMEATPGEHHFQRRISQVIGDEKTVRVEILKDGLRCECRINACELQRTGVSYYSQHYMDAASRAAFVKAYGHRAELLASDIQRICYGKKVLYQKDTD